MDEGYFLKNYDNQKGSSKEPKDGDICFAMVFGKNLKYSKY